MIRKFPWTRSDFDYSEFLRSEIEGTDEDKRSWALAEIRRIQEQKRTMGAIVVVFLVALVLAGLAAGFLEAGIPAGAMTPHANERERAGVMGAVMVSLMWAMAANFCGVLFGFLFGIPKTRQLDKSEDPKSRQETNTNLEQISDWLTKIIVGLGLVEMAKIPRLLDEASTYLARCGVPCVPFAAAILIFFAVFGFLSGYLTTRLFLASAFGRADGDGQGLLEKASKKIGPGGSDGAAGQSGGGGGAVAGPASPSRAAAGASTAAAASASTKDANFLRQWTQAKGHVLEGEFDAAVNEYAELARQAPDDLVIRLEYAWAIFKRDETWSNLLGEQLKRARELSPPAGATSAESLDRRRELYESLCFYPLYREGGYEEAIVAGEEYLRDTNNPLSASIYADLACAYGQKFAAVQAEKGRDAPELGTLRDKALNCVRAAVRLDPVMAKTLQSQMVGRNREENDLAVFADQADFREAVFLPPRRDEPRGG